MGKVLRRNADPRRKTGSGEMATFILSFDIDEGRTTAALLSLAKYNINEDAPFESWMLLDPVCRGDGAQDNVDGAEGEGGQQEMHLEGEEFEDAWVPIYD